MAQHDYVISNASFPNTRSDINNVLTAINTCNSGTSRPSSATIGTIWLDSTNASSNSLTLKFYDGAQDISLANIDTSANTVDWLDSSVSIADNSVTLAKMASGTDGNIISYDGKFRTSFDFGGRGRTTNFFNSNSTRQCNHTSKNG